MPQDSSETPKVINLPFKDENGKEYNVSLPDGATYHELANALQSMRDNLVYSFRSKGAEQDNAEKKEEDN